MKHSARLVERFKSVTGGIQGHSKSGACREKRRSRVNPTKAYDQNNRRMYPMFLSYVATSSTNFVPFCHEISPAWGANPVPTGSALW